ncbi:23S ribosomal RNA methyltransferase Erm [Micromonospora sp. WMMA1363]|uniref:23S ribosomal RNA methyltransferase Erm n=1 Tax=Micromonospora sp. WMMA1363 TaxID=3053985 RepID=UPI00259CE1EE|nr:23S ribosomal RNA methyltransferase Erm [Micromonospora sp. WMMA1363]MDM4722069.1 23S ribosomal RNA methyltransferase Erm [Micromonospora sp. WMMA1363]
MAPYSEYRRARRAYGQNLLADPRAIRTVLAAAEIKPDVLVYEVGAGRGHLTTALLDSGARVVAYEVDPAMSAALPIHPRLRVNGDFLAADPPGERFAVVGNIPYALTAAVVDWCLTAGSMTTATLLVQWEYARKRTGDYGRWSRLTIATWPMIGWRLAGRIPRTAFRPVPRVDGGVLQLTRRAAPLVPASAMSAYERMVDVGFRGVGGSLQASLEGRYRGVASAFRAARIPPDRPVGEVWPEQWLTVFRLLHRRRTDSFG